MCKNEIFLQNLQKKTFNGEKQYLATGRVGTGSIYGLKLEDVPSNG